MKSISVKLLAQISFVLAFISLATPFVWMEIGPGGYLFYGPTVPDIYIFGGFILGKDISFWGISFAIVFQLFFIFYFIVNCLSIIFITRNSNHTLIFTSMNTFLLLVFPVWLRAYVGGVVGNSDCADLTIHYHAGVYIYGLLVLLNALTFLTLFFTQRKG